MSTTVDINALRAALSADLRLTGYGDDVVNVQTTGREMTNADLDAVRAALDATGLREVESWVAAQGVSWLNHGMFAGVSFRVREDES